MSHAAMQKRDVNRTAKKKKKKKSGKKKVTYCLPVPSTTSAQRAAGWGLTGLLAVSRPPCPPQPLLKCCTRRLPPAQLPDVVRGAGVGLWEEREGDVLCTSQLMGRASGEGGRHAVLETAGRAHAFRGWGPKTMGVNQGSWQRELPPEKINREWGKKKRDLASAGLCICLCLKRVGSLIHGRGIAALLPHHAGR